MGFGKWMDDWPRRHVAGRLERQRKWLAEVEEGKMKGN